MQLRLRNHKKNKDMIFSYNNIDMLKVEEDEGILNDIKFIIGYRPTYGYRRLSVILNKKLSIMDQSPVNHKKIYRLMNQNNLLLQKFIAKKVTHPRW